MQTYSIHNPTLETLHLSYNAASLNVNQTDDQIVADNTKQTAVAIQEDGRDGSCQWRNVQ